MKNESLVSKMTKKMNGTTFDVIKSFDSRSIQSVVNMLSINYEDGVVIIQFEGETLSSDNKSLLQPEKQFFDGLKKELMKSKITFKYYDVEAIDAAKKKAEQEHEKMSAGMTSTPAWADFA